MSTTGTPTLMLAQGAFTDSWSWNGVIGRVQAVRVRAKAAAFAEAVIDVEESKT